MNSIGKTNTVQRTVLVFQDLQNLPVKALIIEIWSQINQKDDLNAISDHFITFQWQIGGILGDFRLKIIFPSDAFSRNLRAFKSLPKNYKNGENARNKSAKNVKKVAKIVLRILYRVSRRHWKILASIFQ